MIPINPPVTYHSIRRIDQTGQRLYETLDGSRVPSVTTILSKTKDMTVLNEWRKRVGDEEANRISKESAGLGTLVHTHVENWIEGKDRPAGNNDVRILAKEMSDLIIEKGMKDHVTELWAVEQGLYYPGLYAGTADLIGIYNGKPAIMDHKTTKKMKKREWIEDYFIQCCAYALAHNEVYGTDIKQAAIFMAGRDGSYNTFTIEGTEFDHYAELWTQKVGDYYG